MRTLVTGGAGFIGSNIARALRARGDHVVVLDDLSTGYRVNLEGLAEIEFLEGDVRDPETVHRAVAGCDVVFHLAASVGNVRAIENPVEDSQINVLGTLNILEAARAHGVAKVVFSSSAGIFGELRTLPIREDHPVEPDTPYGVSKLAAEKHCLAYAKIYGLDIVCLRYFNVYGMNQRYDAYGNVIPIFVHRLLRGKPLTIYGDGEQTRDFINVHDVARANLLAADPKAGSGAYNLGSGTSITINGLVTLLREVSGEALKVRHGPPRKGDVRHSRADITAAAEILGFEPCVGLRDGLTRYMSWAREASV